MSDWRTGTIRPHRPLEVVIDGKHYKGWVSQIFRAYILTSEADGVVLTQGWESRVWSILQSAYPNYIIHEPKAVPTPQVSISTIRSFLNMVRKRGFDREIVDESVARERASVCASCPKAGPVTGCTACKSMIMSILNTPKTSLLSKEKAGCTVCGCYVEAKVWIKSEHLKDEVNSHDWDSSCWMLRL